jgi:hypothetical protein
MERSNKTSNDAWNRVNDARLGSMVGASEEYVLALIHNLYVWVGKLEEEMARRIARARSDEDRLDEVGE